MGETREVGKPAQREQTRGSSQSPKNEVRRMGENFDPKEIPPLKLSFEHAYEFGTKSVQAFRSSISAAEAPAGLSHCQRPDKKTTKPRTFTAL